MAGGLYLSHLNLSSDEEAPVQGEPAPDMTGVVDSSFNSKVEQHATTEMQATAAELNKRFASLQGEVDLLGKGRTADQVRIDKLASENAAMQEQLRALGVKPAVSGGEPPPVPPSPAPGPEGEPQPANYPQPNRDIHRGKIVWQTVQAQPTASRPILYPLKPIHFFLPVFVLNTHFLCL